ncbi:MAG TPA: hypothetical protein VHB79_02050 [Polyangiaceae bacterium]|nr:hypothetical protein [Polyangiaceae bacterium]
MKGKPYWLLGVLTMSACGGRSSLLDGWDQRASADSGGSSGGARGGTAAKGGAAPVIGGTFSEGGSSGDLLAHFQLGSDHEVRVADVATSRDRRVAVTGSFRGKLNVGGHVIDSPPRGNQPLPTAAFVASFDGSGKPEWAYAYPNEPEYQATGLRFAPNGDIVFQAHTFYDREPAAVVGRLDPQGQPLWSTAWGQAGHIQTARVGIDNGGRIWLSGSFRSTLDFGGSALDAGLESSGYLLELSSDGGLLRAFGVKAPDWLSSEVQGMAVDDEDNVLVVGTGRLKKDNQALAFLQKFSSSGDLVYAKTFMGNIIPMGVAVDRRMRTTLFAHFSGSFSNEDTVLGAGPAASTLWLAQYSRDGALTWQQAFKGDVTSSGGSTDPFDNIVVAGIGPLVVDGQVLQSPHAAELGSTDLSFVMKLRPDGSRVWLHALGGSITLNGVATDNDAFIWLGSTFESQVWVDDAKLSTKDTAGLLLELSP